MPRLADARPTFNDSGWPPWCSTAPEPFWPSAAPSAHSGAPPPRRGHSGPPRLQMPFQVFHRRGHSGLPQLQMHIPGGPPPCQGHSGLPQIQVPILVFYYPAKVALGRWVLQLQMPSLSSAPLPKQFWDSTPWCSTSTLPKPLHLLSLQNPIIMCHQYGFPSGIIR